MTDRRRAGRSNDERSNDERSIQIGGFAAAFGGVLVMGGLLLGGVWWRGNRSGQTSSTTDGRTTASAPPAAIAHDPLTGVTAAGEPQIGLATAPVEIIEYGDFLCPNCRQFARDVMPAIKDRWIRTGLVRIVHRDFIVFGAESERAAEAAHCAGEQGRFWRFSDGLFALREDGEPLDVDHLELLARSLDLDAAAFASCAASGRHRARIAQTTASAKAQGFTGTPVYLINGRKVVGALPLDQWAELFRLYEQEFALGLATPTTGP